MDDNVWPVYHPARGEEGRETGRMERPPSQREMGEPCQQPSLPRTPKKPLLPTLLSPPQETCDLSLEAYFHHRTKQSILTQGSLEIAHARPAPAGTGAPVNLHRTWWVCTPQGGLTASYNSCVSMSKQWNTWCGGPLILSPRSILCGQFSSIKAPSSKLTERQIAGRFCCFGFSGRWAAGKVLEAEFPGDWAPHRSWHWKTFVFFDSPATWWRKSSCKLGRKDSKPDGVCITPPRGTKPQETRGRGRSHWEEF